MALYLDRHVRPFGCVDSDRMTVHRLRVPCVDGGFGDMTVAEAVRLARQSTGMARLDRDHVLRVLVDPNDP